MKRSKKLLATILFTTTLLNAATIVTVNGKDITQDDVYGALMQGTQGQYNQLPPAKQTELSQRVVNQMVSDELIYGDAKKSGVLKSKDFKDGFKKAQEALKKSIAIQIWKKNQYDKVKVSQKELKKSYKENKDEFVFQEEVRASHILVKTEDEAKAIIKELSSLKGEKLKAKFAELAKVKSTGPSGPNGGDLNYFRKGQMVPAFDKEVFNMKVGTITKNPVKTQFGYHVILLTDKKSAKQATFEEARPTLENRLKQEKAMKSMEKKMKVLVKNANIVKHKQ